jgi:hypothetical protein
MTTARGNHRDYVRYRNTTTKESRHVLTSTDEGSSNEKEYSPTNGRYPLKEGEMDKGDPPTAPLPYHHPRDTSDESPHTRSIEPLSPNASPSHPTPTHHTEYDLVRYRPRLYLTLAPPCVNISSTTSPNYHVTLVLLLPQALLMRMASLSSLTTSSTTSYATHRRSYPTRAPPRVHIAPATSTTTTSSKVAICPRSRVPSMRRKWKKSAARTLQDSSYGT